MADEKLLRILEKGSLAWNAWRLVRGDDRIDLPGIDLRRANLSGINLSRTDLSPSCRPTGTNLNA